MSQFRYTIHHKKNKAVRGQTRTLHVNVVADLKEERGPNGDAIQKVVLREIARASVIFDKRANEVDLEVAKELVTLVDAAAGNGLRTETGGDIIFMTEQPEFGSEAIGLLAAMVILFIAFGSLIAMGLPSLFVNVMACVGDVVPMDCPPKLALAGDKVAAWAQDTQEVASTATMAASRI